MATTENTQREEAREVKHVTLVGLVINILLGVAKIAAGVLDEVELWWLTVYIHSPTSLQM